jgi:hypothetical protein
MIIFWERAKKPVTLTAGNFVTLSLTTLTGVSNKQIKRVVYTTNIFVSFHMQDLGKHLLNIKSNLKNLQKLNTDNLVYFSDTTIIIFIFRCFATFVQRFLKCSAVAEMWR